MAFLLSYGVDSLILLLQSVISTQAFWEFGEKGYSAGLTVAVYGEEHTPILPFIRGPGNVFCSN